MKKITVYGVRDQRKTVMDLLQQAGCVEFQKADFSDESLNRIDTSEKIMQFDRYISSAKQALGILEQYLPEKTGFFSSKKEISMEHYSMKASEIDTIGNIVFEIVSLSKKIQENKIAIGRFNSQIIAVTPWINLDVNMNITGTKSVKTALYNLPYDITTEALDEIFKDNDEVYYEVVSSSKDLSCIIVMYLKEFSEQVEKTIREAGFVQPPFSLSHRNPKTKVEKLKQQIRDVQKEISQMEGEIIEFAKIREDIKLYYDHLILRRDKYKELSNIQQTKQTFIIKGFIPEKLGDKVKKKLENKADCQVFIEDVPENEEAPVLFENSGFSSPVEEITRTYSMPSKNDIDPNTIMAFFYYLFFGMMFSDAGYGLLVVLVTGYIVYFTKVQKHTKNNMKMFFFCGISTTFWGLMYGSFFGNVVNAVSLTFFGNEVSLKPIWIDPVKEPLTLLIFSVALGLIQIIIALCIKFYMLWRINEKQEAIWDVGSWILMLLGISVLAIGMAIGIQVIVTIGTIMAIVSVLGVILMKGRDKKNIVLRILSGILGLYDVTGYISDALSYSRLMALGLATGVIAQVVNIMGGLAGGSVVGAIMFIVIFIVGHAMNFAINMLGAYVHTNRLQYVEFFSKFYEGGGRKFEPLTMNTNYYEFMED